MPKGVTGSRGQCSECERTARARGFCGTHLSRFYKHGSPDVVLKQTPHGKSGSDHHMWTGDQASYNTAHKRIRYFRGPASDHICVSCVEIQAVEWAYDHTDPDEKQEVRFWRGKDRTLSYSTDPAYYVPLCRSCHVRFDRDLEMAA